MPSGYASASHSARRILKKCLLAAASMQAERRSATGQCSSAQSSAISTGLPGRDGLPAAGEHVWILRAVDDAGEMLDMTVQRLLDTGAAFGGVRRLLSNHPVEPVIIVTDALWSFSAAPGQLYPGHGHQPGLLRDNNRFENSHLSVR